MTRDLGRPLADLDTAGDDLLATLADTAFRIGLEDGRTLKGPVNRTALMRKLPDHPRRRLHTAKLRQVYGAGFDISANERAPKKEPLTQA